MFFVCLMFCIFYFFSLSLSTLSMSSGSSLGSLGSLSASSRGSLNSLSTLDVYGQATGVTGSGLGVMGSEVNLQELHQRVEKLLQGHSMSPISEAASPTTTPIPHADITAAATNNYLQSVMAGGLSSPGPASSEGTAKSSPYSSAVSSPPVSPYVIGAPPTYEQHMSCVQRVGGLLPGSAGSMLPGSAGSVLPGSMLPGSAGSKWGRPGTDLTPHTILEAEEGGAAVGPPLQDSGQRVNGGPLTPAAVPPSSLPPVPPPHTPQPPPPFCIHPELCQGAGASLSTGGVDSVTASSQACGPTDKERDVALGAVAPANQRRVLAAGLDNVDVSSNPPLSPISESSSGVGNNLSGGNTRSVSAAVSDESVAGDSGVFEATVKRSVLSFFCAQVCFTVIT